MTFSKTLRAPGGTVLLAAALLLSGLIPPLLVRQAGCGEPALPPDFQAGPPWLAVKAPAAPRPVPSPVPVADAVPVGQIIAIPVTNLTPEVARLCQVIYYPTKGVVCQPCVGWDGSISILFASQNAGTYLVAVCSPGENGAVAKGQIEVTVGTPTPTPPTPPVPPVPPPTPPVPAGKASALIGIVGLDGGPSSPSWKGTKVTSALAQAGGKSVTLGIAEVNDPKTPDADLRWIGHAAGHPLPWVIVADQAGNILWQGADPGSDDALLAVLTPFLQTSPRRTSAQAAEQPEQPACPNCPGGVCPTVPFLRRPWR